MQRSRRLLLCAALFRTTAVAAAEAGVCASASSFLGIAHNLTMTHMLDGASDASTTDSSCKRIAFVRHAEGIHNRDSRERRAEFHAIGGLTETAAYLDAPLTTIGEGQCEHLADTVKSTGFQPEAVIVSPLRRAVVTATIGFGNTSTLPYIGTELCRERVSRHTV